MKPVEKGEVSTALAELERFCASVGETGWSRTFGELARRLAPAEDLPAIERIVADIDNSWGGAMGGLTDLMISPTNGHKSSDFDEANRRLDQLRHRLWEATH